MALIYKTKFKDFSYYNELQKNLLYDEFFIFLLPNKYDEDSREAVSSEYAFETFSKAGFKPLSSICEIIDNSIEAD